jgi:TonB family protein
MFLRSAIIGSGVTIIFVVILAASRISDDLSDEDIVELNDIEVFGITPPPPPLDFVEPEPDDSQLEPDNAALQAPSLDVPLDMPSADLPSIAPSPRTASLTTPLQMFHEDLPPAAIPNPTVVISNPKPRPQNKVVAPVKPLAVVVKAKEHYDVGQLDRLPVEKKKGGFTWPSSLKSSSGIVKLQVEIDTSGRVRVIRVVDSTDEALNNSAIKVATGSLFSVPTVNGQPVKTQFFKSYKLQKPR